MQQKSTGRGLFGSGSRTGADSEGAAIQRAGSGFPSKHQKQLYTEIIRHTQSLTQKAFSDRYIGRRYNLDDGFI
jgi:hypothetical protein